MRERRDSSRQLPAPSRFSRDSRQYREIRFTNDEYQQIRDCPSSALRGIGFHSDGRTFC